MRSVASFARRRRRRRTIKVSPSPRFDSGVAVSTSGEEMLTSRRACQVVCGKGPLVASVQQSFPPQSHFPTLHIFLSCSAIVQETAAVVPRGCQFGVPVWAVVGIAMCTLGYRTALVGVMVGYGRLFLPVVSTCPFLWV